MPETTCPECGAILRFPDAMAGKTARCPRCRAAVTAAASPAPARPVERDDPRPVRPARRPARDEDDRPTRRPRRKAKPADPLTKARRLAIFGGLGLLALVLAVGGIVAAVLAFGGRGGAGGGLGGLAGAVGEGEGAVAVGPARQPPHGASPKPADAPAGWKVTADGVAAPAGLRSAFPLPAGGQPVFARPDSAVGGVVLTKGHGFDTWTRLDLRRPDPVGVVKLNKPVQTHFWSYSFLDLTPTGDRLYFSDAQGHGWVWETDGRITNVLQSVQGRPDPLPDLVPVQWAGFVRPDRLLLVGRESKAAFLDVPTPPAGAKEPEAKLTETRKLPGVMPFARSPGRKWLAGMNPERNGVSFWSLPDLEPAGSLPFPPGVAAAEVGIDRVQTAGLAFSPDGARLAALVHTKQATYVLTWDLTTGRGVDALAFPRSGGHPAIQWVGPRAVSIGVIIDLDLGVGIGNCVQSPCPTPDGRVWNVVSAAGDPVLVKRLAAALPENPPKGDPKEGKRFLVAGTPLRPKLTARLDEIKAGGAVLGLSKPVRAEVAHPDKAVAEAEAERFADILAKAGVPTDPAAPTAARLRFHPAFLRISQAAAGSGDGVVRLVAPASLELVGRDGKTLWTGPRFIGQADVERGAVAQLVLKYPESDRLNSAGPKPLVETGIDAGAAHPAEAAAARAELFKSLGARFELAFPDQKRPAALVVGPDGEVLPPVEFGTPVDRAAE